jgi:Flp pilus assembly protein TadG
MIILQQHFHSLHISDRRNQRRGATLVEAAIALSAIITIIVGALDFSIAAYKSQVLNHIAQRIGRSAVIHGSLSNATWNGGRWGPSTITTNLSSTNPVATNGNTISSGLHKPSVTIELTWPNGNNNPGSPVIVQASMDWSPMLINRMGYHLITLRGRSYQIIQH